MRVTGCFSHVAHGTSRPRLRSDRWRKVGLEGWTDTGNVGSYLGKVYPNQARSGAELDGSDGRGEPSGGMGKLGKLGRLRMEGVGSRVKNEGEC